MAPLSTMVVLLMMSCAAAAEVNIFDAVAQDSMEQIKKALKGGADINQKEAGSGQTPLSKTYRSLSPALLCASLNRSAYLHGPMPRAVCMLTLLLTCVGWQ